MALGLITDKDNLEDYDRINEEKEDFLQIDQKRKLSKETKKQLDLRMKPLIREECLDPYKNTTKVKLFYLRKNYRIKKRKNKHRGQLLITLG